MYCFSITIFRLAIPAFFRFANVTQCMIGINTDTVMITTKIVIITIMIIMIMITG